jgi:hypothetical protein
MSDEDINEQELDRFEERYFGTMPEATAVAFDAELTHDPEMRERYELFVITVRGLQSVGSHPDEAKTHALRKKFSEIDRELDGMEIRVRRLFQPWMGWAAAVLVLVGVAGVWWPGRGDTPQRLADEFAVPEPGLPVLMGTSPRVMDAIMNAYKQHDRATAMQLLSVALHHDPANDTLLYFDAVVHDQESACAKVDLFERVSSGSVFAAKARFHRALCALRSADTTRARKLLNEVVQGDDVQLATRARDLLDRLDRL